MIRFSRRHIQDSTPRALYRANEHKWISEVDDLNHSSQFISVKVKKDLRKSQTQFREILRKLRLRQNNDFLIKKNVYITTSSSEAVFCFLVISFQFCLQCGSPCALPNAWDLEP